MRDFIEEVCFLLKITVPEIICDISHFESSTMIAQCSSDGKIIYLRKMEKGPDYYFAISHELRHVWQIRKKPELLEGYKTVKNIELDEYNRQPAEVDANAFAQIVMVDLFGIKPLWKGMKEDIVILIEKRVNELENEF